jgi:hypothetical protein
MPPKTVAIVTFNRFNELDSLIALHLIGRVKEYGIAADGGSRARRGAMTQRRVRQE